MTKIAFAAMAIIMCAVTASAGTVELYFGKSTEKGSRWKLKTSAQPDKEWDLYGDLGMHVALTKDGGVRFESPIEPGIILRLDYWKPDTISWPFHVIEITVPSESRLSGDNGNGEARVDVLLIGAGSDGKPAKAHTIRSNARLVDKFEKYYYRLLVIASDADDINAMMDLDSIYVPATGSKSSFRGASFRTVMKAHCLIAMLTAEPGGKLVVNGKTVFSSKEVKR